MGWAELNEIGFERGFPAWGTIVSLLRRATVFMAVEFRLAVGGEIPRHPLFADAQLGPFEGPGVQTTHSMASFS